MFDLIQPEVLTVIFWFVGGVLLAALSCVGIMASGRAVQRKRWPEPETHGDWGGFPMPSEPGDEFYAKRKAENMTGDGGSTG